MGYPPFKSKYSQISDNILNRQWIGHGSPINGRFGVNEGTWTEVWEITDGQLQQFIKDVVGWGDKAGTKINRRLPKQHPELGFLWTSGISAVEGVGSLGKRQVGVGGWMAAWKELKCTVNYSTPPYNIKSNDATTNEWERFVTYDEDSVIDVLERTGGSSGWKWPAAAPNVSDKVIHSKLAPTDVQVLVKTRKVWNWIQVPDDGLYNNNGVDSGGRALNIESCLGCVNGAPWHGYEAGTLLFDGWKPTPFVMPIPPANASTVPRAFNVQLRFLFFDPPPGEENKRGHNLVPHPTNGLWYRPYKIGGADSPLFWRYPIANFDRIFQMN